MNNALPRHATALACCGLLPYFAAPLSLTVWPNRSELILALFATYSFGIIAFLLGAWWGLALIRRGTAALWMSNGLFIIAFLGKGLLADGSWLLVAAALMIAIWLAEGLHWLFRPQPVYYRRLRGTLSWVAAVCLLSASHIT